MLRVPAYLASAHLTFDDGVFGASAVAMRAGGKPFAEVFSSQGPLFLPLVWAGDLLGGRTASSPRLLAVLSGCLLVGAVYALGRSVADRAGALLAGALVGTSIGLLGITAPLAADGPALAFATVGVALAVAWRRSPTPWHAVGIGLAVGAALSVKSLVAPAVVPVALVLLAWRRPRLVVLAAATSLAFHVAVSVPWGLADVWDQSYAYHLEVAGERTPVANLGKTLSTLADRELPLVVAGALAAAVAAGRLRRGRTGAAPADAAGGASLLDRLVRPSALLLAWLLAVVAVLAVVHPMWRPHVAQLVPAGALLAARHRPRWPVLGAAAVLILPWQVVDTAGRFDYRYGRSTAAVVDAIADLPEGALAISDEPGLVWRAGRRTTDDLVDASLLRIEAGQIDAASLAATAARADVCAVAVRSAVRWGSFEDLPERLAAAGYEPAVDDDRGRVLYVKRPCRPG